MPYRKPTHKELEKSRDHRLAHARKVQQENYINLLLQAKTLLGAGNPYASGAIDQLLKTGTQDLHRLNQLCGGHIVPRKRPQHRQSGDYFHVYIDECGAHALRSADVYRVFVLSAVIIRDSDFDSIDKIWKDFKSRCAARMGC